MTGDEIAGYVIESFIARGGMAVVYRARDVRLNRRVALKLLAPELTENENFRQRFMRESRLAASIDHPHIIPIYRAGLFEDVLYLAMRYVEGTDLSGLLAQRGPLPLDLAAILFGQVAAALDTAHAHGLVHRDVKPGNILVAQGTGSNDHHLYLTDFGLTKRTASLSGLTAPGHFLGTVDYVAPEQITGGPTDARTDVYGLGCVLYEALTGRRPFDRDAEAAVLYAHLSDPPPSVFAARPDLPAAVDRVVATAMAKEPDKRFTTCHGLVAELQLIGSVAAPADPVSTSRRVPSAGRELEDSRSTRHRVGLPQPAKGVRSPLPPPGAGSPSTRPTRERRTPLTPPPAERNAAPPLTPAPPISGDHRDRWILMLIRASLVVLTVVALYLMFGPLEP